MGDELGPALEVIAAGDDELGILYREVGGGNLLVGLAAELGETSADLLQSLRVAISMGAAQVLGFVSEIFEIGLGGELLWT